MRCSGHDVRCDARGPCSPRRGGGRVAFAHRFDVVLQRADEQVVLRRERVAEAAAPQAPVVDAVIHDELRTGRRTASAPQRALRCRQYRVGLEFHLGVHGDRAQAQGVFELRAPGGEEAVEFVVEGRGRRVVGRVQEA